MNETEMLDHQVRMSGQNQLMRVVVVVSVVSAVSILRRRMPYPESRSPHGSYFGAIRLYFCATGVHWRMSER